MQGKKVILVYFAYYFFNRNVILLTILQKLAFCLYMPYNVQYTLKGMSCVKLHAMWVEQYPCINVQWTYKTSLRIEKINFHLYRIVWN